MYMKVVLSKSPPPRHASYASPMTEPEAVALARAVAERQGWPFLEPISIVYRRRWFRRGGVWTIHTHTSGMTAQVGMRIDDRTGEVIEKRFVNMRR